MKAYRRASPLVGSNVPFVAVRRDHGVWGGTADLTELTWRNPR
jgi:hypothetical protein